MDYWFWYAFVGVWAILVGLKLYQICKRRNMAAQARARQGQAVYNNVNGNNAYYGLSESHANY